MGKDIFNLKRCKPFRMIQIPKNLKKGFRGPQEVKKTLACETMFNLKSSGWRVFVAIMGPSGCGKIFYPFEHL